MKMTVFSNQKDVLLIFLKLLFIKGAKKDKNAFNLVFRFLAFPEIPEILETHAHKKLNLQHNCKTGMSRIMVFWSDHEIKTP